MAGNKAVGNLYVKLMADARQLTSTVGGVPADVRRMAAEVSATRMTLPQPDAGGLRAFGLGAGQLAGLAAGAGALGLLGGAAVKAALDGQKLSTEYRKAAISFKYLTGDAKTAQQTVDDLRAVARDSPFDADSITRGAKKFMSGNLEAREAVALARSLGDVAAATGVDYGLLAHAVSNVMGKGKLMAEELNQQFGEMGLGASFFAKHMGVSEEAFVKMVTDGKVSANDVLKMLADLTKEGGQFRGAMKELADADPMAKLNNHLEDTKRLFYDGLAGLVGFEDGLKGVAEWLGQVNALSKARGGLGSSVWAGAKEWMEDAVFGWKAAFYMLGDSIRGGDAGTKQMIEEFKEIERMRAAAAPKIAKDPIPDFKPKDLFRIPPEVKEFIDKSVKEFKELNLAGFGSMPGFKDQGFGEYSQFRREAELARRGLIENFRPGDGIDGRVHDQIVGTAFLELERRAGLGRVESPRAVEAGSQEAHALLARMGDGTQQQLSAQERVRLVLEQMKQLEERQAQELKRLADAVLRSDIKPVTLPR